jgi:hypothetical protein
MPFASFVRYALISWHWRGHGWDGIRWLSAFLKRNENLWLFERRSGEKEIDLHKVLGTEEICVELHEYQDKNNTVIWS